MNYIVLDLEATCWDKGMKYQNEIIEIGALKINETKEIVSEFQSFVKPIRFPILSDFCKELTSITQEQVDAAAHFYEIIAAFKEWAEIEKEAYVLCSWGNYDKNQFISDCKLHHLNSEWTNRHISVKHQYRDIKKLRRPIGMKWALEKEKIQLEGTHHRGIDDARNIAKIFIKYFEEWDFENCSSKVG